MADPLRINVEVDVSQVAKLAEASQQVATSVSSMADQFAQGTAKAAEIAAGISSLASQMLATSPRVLELSSTLVGLQSQYQVVKAAAAESSAEIVAAGGATGVAKSYFANYNIELAQTALLKQQISVVEKEYQAALAQSYTAVQASIIAQKEAQVAAAEQLVVRQQAAAEEIAANEGMVASEVQSAAIVAEQEELKAKARLVAAQAAQDARAEEAAANEGMVASEVQTAAATATQGELAAASKTTAASLNETAAAALRFGQAIYANSPAVQAQAQRVAELTQALAQLKAAQAEASSAGTGGLEQEQSLKTAVTLTTKALTAAEKELANQKGLSLESFLESQAALEKEAAARAVAAQAAMDAQAQEAAANEGMVASEVEISAATEEAAAKIVAAKMAAADAELQRQQVERAGMELAAGLTDIAGANADVTLQSAAAADTHSAALVKQAGALSVTAQGMQKQLAAGISLKDIISNLGLTAEKAAAAMAELGVTAEGTGIQMQESGAKVDAMTRALAYSDVRLLAFITGFGQLGFAIARLGAMSETLAPILSVLFPVAAAIAFADIVETGITKFEKYREEVAKASREAADFEIQSYKTADGIELENQKLEAQISTLEGAPVKNGLQAALLEAKIAAEELGKTLASDVEKSISLLNVGTFGQFFTAASGPEEQFKAKLQAILLQVDQARLALAKAPPGSDAAEAAINAQIDAYKRLSQQIDLDILDVEGMAGSSHKYDETITKLKELQTGYDEAGLSLQEMQKHTTLEITAKGLQDSGAAGQKDLNDKVAEAKLATDEAQAKLSNEINLTSLETQEQQAIDFENRKKQIADDGLARRKVILAQTETAQPKADFSKAEEAYNKDVEINTQTHVQRLDEIFATYYKEIQSRDLEAGNAEIDSDQKVLESKLKLAEAQEKLAFDKAANPAEIEAAAAAQIQTTTEMYQSQIAVLQQKAALQEKQLPANVPVSTAQLGTLDFSKWLDSLTGIAGPIHDKLMEMNADAIALANQEGLAVGQIEADSGKKSAELYVSQFRSTLTESMATTEETMKRVQGGAEIKTSEVSQSPTATQGQKIAAEQSTAKAAFEATATAIHQEQEALDALAIGYELQDLPLAQQIEMLHQIDEARKKLTEDGIANAQRLAEADKKAAQAYQEEFTKAFNTVENAFQSSFDGVIRGTESVKFAFIKLGGDVVLAAIHATEQQLMKYAQMEAMKLALHITSEHAQTTATATGESQRESISLISFAKWMAREAEKFAVWIYHEITQTTAAATAAATKLSIETANHVATVSMYAGEAAAAAFASTAAIPITGPELAPAAAAAAFGATISFGSAERGALVPQDMGIMAHAGEMVLPENISSPLQKTLPAMNTFSAAMSQGLATSGAPNGRSGALGLGSSGASGGARTSMTNVTVNAMDAGSLRDFIHRNQRQFVGSVKGLLRNGAKL